MNHRLTRKLVLILAIPLCFELALFSTCAMMLNLAEAERSFESESMRVVAPIALLIGQSMRQVCNVAQYYSTQERVAADKYSQVSKSLAAKIKNVETVGEDYPQYQSEIVTISECSKDLSRQARKIAELAGQGDLSTLLIMEESIKKLDGTSNELLTSLSFRRSELKKQDATIRSVFQAILFTSLVLSILVGATGILAFYRLVCKPLKDLADQSISFARGESFKKKFESDDEIGDLYESFVEMADSIEKANRIERAIFENTADVVCTIDSRFCFENVNSAVRGVLGYEPDQLIGTRVSKLIADGQAERVVENLKRISQKDSLGSFESSLEKSSGTNIDVVWSVRYSDEDNLLYCTLYDVNYERQTERISRHLRRSIADELRQKLHRAYDTVAGIEKTAITSEVSKRHIDRLEIGLEKLIHLLSSLELAVGSDPIATTVSKEAVAAESLLQSTVSAIESLARDKHIQFLIESDECIVEVDSTQIQRALTNLISNAIKVSPEKGVIHLEARENQGNVRFFVRDEGPGIPLHRQHMLFERFSQVGRQSSREGKGTGLGLVSAKEIVALHDGRIGIVSDGVSGTTFWFDIPMVAVC